MAVRATDPEGTHAEQRGAVGYRLHRALHPKIELPQRNLRIGCAEPRGRHEDARANAQRGLDESGDARGRLQMADVRLDRPHPQWARGPTGGTDRLAQRGGLDRVSDARARAVQLDIGDIARVGARTPVGGPDHLGLRPLRGRRQLVTAPVIVHRAAAKHAVDLIPIGDGGRQWFEHDGTAAFALAETVRPCVEDVAPPVGGQSAEAVGGDRMVRRQPESDATRDRDGTITSAEAFRGDVDSHERGRLPGIDDKTGAIRPQEVRNAVGDDAAQGAGERVWRDRIRAPLADQHAVVVARHADEDAERAARDGLAGDSGILKRFPAELQQEPLLRVHHRGLVRRDAEEGGVEAGDIAQERALPDDAGLIRAQGVQQRPVPAPFRDRRINRGTRGQQRPQRRRTVRAREAAGQSDDGDITLGRVRWPPRRGNGAILAPDRHLVPPLFRRSVLRQQTAAPSSKADGVFRAVRGTTPHGLFQRRRDRSAQGHDAEAELVAIEDVRGDVHAPQVSLAFLSVQVDPHPCLPTAVRVCGDPTHARSTR